MIVSRRGLILSGVTAALGGAVFLTARKLDRAGLKAESNEFYTSLPIPRLIDAREVGNKIDLVAKSSITQFLPNLDTESYGYSAPYLGPVVRVHRGDSVKMTVSNQLDSPTTVHWHGVLVSSEFDGGPYNSIAPGETWQPVLNIDQPAATAWFHPQLHRDAGRQTYMGLTGLLYVEDGSAADLGLPNRYGLDDFPLVLQDRAFGPDGELVYESSPAATMHGYRGSTIIVNGAIGPVAEVPKGLVRLRLLNAANARNFHLTFDDNRLMHVIATDNGYVPAPLGVRELTIAPGERFEVLVDFSDGEVAAILTYPDHLKQSASAMPEFASEIFRHMTDVLTPVVRFDPVDTIPIGAKAPPPKLVDKPAVQVPGAAQQRSFILDSMAAINTPILENATKMPTFKEQGITAGQGQPQPAGVESKGKPASAAGVRMGINGSEFDMTRLDATVRVGDQEIWEITGTDMAHPFHIHGASFHVLQLDRMPAPEHLAGPKDTVLVNRQALLLVNFTQKADPSMPFVFHCSILEHQDAGMMAQYTAV